MLSDPITFDDTELHSSLYSAQPETGYGTGGGGDSTNTPQENSIFHTLPEQVNAILSEFPGFGGLCLVIDKAEQFPGVEWFPPNTVISLPRTGSQTINNIESVIEGAATLLFDPGDYIGAAMYSTSRTIIDNLTPFFIRLLVTSIGLILVASLVWKAINSVPSPFQGSSNASTAISASKAIAAMG